MISQSSRRRFLTLTAGAGVLALSGCLTAGDPDPVALVADNIEAVTDRTAWTLNNSKDIQMAQGLSADITMRDYD